ncbi:hypothetical protein, partial [Salmonella enterica]|uniref:hypothetical protein n=1 Tax=Salmonella enterica TaxID=28901 RepID=UPI00329A7C34
GFVRHDDPEAPSAPPSKQQQPDRRGHNGGPPLDLVAEDAAAKAVSFAADDPRPLYVYRQLLNAGELLDWALEQGFKATLT